MAVAPRESLVRHAGWTSATPAHAVAAAANGGSWAADYGSEGRDSGSECGWKEFRPWWTGAHNCKERFTADNLAKPVLVGVDNCRCERERGTT